MEYFTYSDSFIELVDGDPRDLHAASLMIAVNDQGLAGASYLPSMKRLSVERIASKYTGSSFWRFVSIFYNPVVPIEAIWSNEQDYELGELRSKITEAVTSNGDLFTQFKTEEEIIKRLNDSDSFEELVSAFKWMSEDDEG